MKVFLCLAFLLCWYLGSEAKVYSQCELYNMFQETGLAGYHGYSAANWICLAYLESRYNTKAVNNKGPSRNYGIFQINSKWWCNDGETAGAEDACQISCQSLLNDDIHDDIECAKQVMRDSNDTSTWAAWRNYCSVRKVDRFMKGC
ncbi:lysozyme C-1-like [Engystomops pustulosus]|uniref:lysozyme C-1-like n=1 Tax=Engystomops pustulosus TaxID=76066 RepID=UPI003AFA9508